MYKMYCVFALLSVAACVTTVYSAVAIQLPVDKPEAMAQEEGCYIPDLDKVLPYNTPYSPQDATHCRQYTCKKDNITTIFTCGSIGVGDGCEIIPGDKSLPYPQCCDTATCSNSINQNSIAT